MTKLRDFIMFKNRHRYQQPNEDLNNLPDLDHTAKQTRHSKDTNFTQMGPLGSKPDAQISTTSKLFEIFYNPLFDLSDRYEKYNIKHRSCVGRGF